MSSAKHTDAELIEALRLIEQHESVAAASRATGIPVSTLKVRRDAAKAHGLTSKSKVVDHTAQLETKLKVLQRELAQINRENLTAQEIRKTLYGLAELTPDPPAWIMKAHSSGSSGVPMVLLSDLHWGEKVSSEEVGGLNAYDRKIAVRRLHTCVDAVLDLALHHMVNPQYPGIVVCLGGDMITGTIHEELQDTNDGYVQQALLELQEQLISALSVFADKFGKVFVPCVVGNHGRMTKKPRMKGRVYTSFEWNLYCQLERHFRLVGDKRVQFFIPGEADAYFSVLGHRFLLTHGDALGVKGGDGIIGALGPIARGAVKVGRSESQVGRDFDTLLMGHWHTYIPRGEATPVIVNGTLKGYDEFARLGLRVPFSRPSQALWFVHEKYGITAQWQVFVDKDPVKRDTRQWVTWEK